MYTAASYLGAKLCQNAKSVLGLRQVQRFFFLKILKKLAKKIWGFGLDLPDFEGLLL
jgi:hypothetical protein